MWIIEIHTNKCTWEEDDEIHLHIMSTVLCIFMRNNIDATPRLKFFSDVSIFYFIYLSGLLAATPYLLVHCNLQHLIRLRWFHFFEYSPVAGVMCRHLGFGMHAITLSLMAIYRYSFLWILVVHKQNVGLLQC